MRLTRRGLLATVYGTGLAACTPAAVTPAAVPEASHDLPDATQIASMIRNKEITASEAVEEAIKRAEADFSRQESLSTKGFASKATFDVSQAGRDQAQAAGSASALIGLLSFVIGGMMAPLVGLGGGQTAVPLALVIVLAETAAVFSYFFLVRSAKL